MDIDKTLTQLETDLAGLLSDVPPVELKEFANKAEFLTYCKEQISLAKADEDAEVRKARLTHLMVNVGVAKNGFQDNAASSLPVFSGPLSVQAQTAWKERSESEMSPAAASASTAPGPLGFAQKDGKPLTIESLMAAFETMLAGPDGDDAKKGEAETATETTEEAAETETTEEATETETTATEKADPWGTGLDMNGSSSSDDPDDYAGTLRAF